MLGESSSSISTYSSDSESSVSSTTVKPIPVTVTDPNNKVKTVVSPKASLYSNQPSVRVIPIKLVNNQDLRNLPPPPVEATLPTNQLAHPIPPKPHNFGSTLNSNNTVTTTRVTETTVSNRGVASAKEAADLRNQLFSPNSNLLADEEIQRVFSVGANGRVQERRISTDKVHPVKPIPQNAVPPRPKSTQKMSNNMHHQTTRTFTEETVKSSRGRQPQPPPSTYSHASYGPRNPSHGRNSSAHNYRREPSEYSARPKSQGRQPFHSGYTTGDLRNMASAMGPEFLDQRLNEKENLKNLNTRFASYIEKVRSLEVQNKALEAQLHQAQLSRPTNVDKMYEEELKRLRHEMNELTQGKDRAEMQRQNLIEDANKWKHKFSDEHQLRKEHEHEVQQLRKDCDDATLIRTDLERRLNSTMEDVEFQRRATEQQIHELQDQLSHQQSIKIEAPPGPDLMSELAKMRDHYEELADKNRAEMDEWANSKVQQATEQAGRDHTYLTEARDQVDEYRKQQQTLTIEIQTLRDQNSNLQNAMDDLNDRHRREVDDYREQVRDLTNKFEESKAQMADQIRQHQELMSVKMALDLEIAAYRKLLEGEEVRINDRLTQSRMQQRHY